MTNGVVGVRCTDALQKSFLDALASRSNINRRQTRIGRKRRHSDLGRRWMEARQRRLTPPTVGKDRFRLRTKLKTLNAYLACTECCGAKCLLYCLLHSRISCDSEGLLASSKRRENGQGIFLLNYTNTLCSSIRIQKYKVGPLKK